jgi:TetR/AcrR family transcriptional regulator, acrAB operon repressor
MARRTKQQAQATRDLILDAAERVFQQKGVSRSSLNDIAQAAGLTRGAIYWHFADKADLFNAMMERVTLPLEASVRLAADPARLDPVEDIRRSFTEALRRTVADPQMRRVFEIASHKVEYGDELQAVRERRMNTRAECLAQVERGLTLAMRRGHLARRMPARAAAVGLHALIDGLIQNWMLDPTQFDLLRVGRQVLDAYLAGLNHPKTPATATTPARARA